MRCPDRIMSGGKSEFAETADTSTYREANAVGRFCETPRRLTQTPYNVISSLSLATLDRRAKSIR